MSLPVDVPVGTPPDLVVNRSDPAAAGGHAGASRRRWLAWLAALGVTAICGLLLWHIGYKSTHVAGQAIGIVYTIVVGAYVVSRFVLAALYRPPPPNESLPSVAIIVPAFNEGPAVARTIDACMAIDYPAHLVECVVVDDGSADDTLAQMKAAAARHPAGRVRCLTLGRNQGKRAAMAAGIRASTADVLVFIDSDSQPDPDAVRLLVQSFADPRVGAVSGISFVRNAQVNLLTKMQSARYFVSFQLLKAAESTLGAVSCCSGCFAAYRRSAVIPVLADWEQQRFLGAPCTYGDDRALTNRVIKSGWRSLYDSRACAWTDAPTRYRTFFRQQLRWKKSWLREGTILLSHIWRSRPIAFPSVLIATITGLLSPFIVILNLFARPIAVGAAPLLYLTGLYLVAMAYGLFHRSWREDRLWLYAILGTFFYLVCSIQLLWAIVRIRDGSWGTRGSGAASSSGEGATSVGGPEIVTVREAPVLLTAAARSEGEGAPGVRTPDTLPLVVAMPDSVGSGSAAAHTALARTSARRE